MAKKFMKKEKAEESMKDMEAGKEKAGEKKHRSAKEVRNKLYGSKE